MKKLFALLILALFPSVASAYTSTCTTPCSKGGTTWTCSDISRDCVQDAVIASEADWNASNQIVLASGSVSWAATGGVECTSGSPYPMCFKRGVKISGAGVDSTTIKLTGWGQYGGITFWPNATAQANNEAFNIGYMTVDGNWTYFAGGNIATYNYSASLMDKIRVHHIKFKNSGFNSTTVMHSGTFGVTDNCTFQDSQIWERSEDSDAKGWDRNLREYGTKNAMYYEDNTIMATGDILVANPGPSTEWSVGDTITGLSSGVTSVISAIHSASAYAPRKFYQVTSKSGDYTSGEILTNGTYQADQLAGYPYYSGNVGYFMHGSGGSAHVRYNSIDMTYNNDNQWADLHGLQSMESRPDGQPCGGGDGCPGETCYEERRCCQQYSTVKTEMYGNFHTNNSKAVAYRIVHRGSWMMYFNNVASGTYNGEVRPRGHEYSCDSCQDETSTTRWSQKIQNTYVFNNPYNSANQTYYIDIDDCARFVPSEAITENTHFWNYNTNTLNGSTQKGINCGSPVPSSPCSTGDGYWQTTASPCSTPPATLADMKTYTQAGKLWKCTAPDTWTEYYTPYTYPHPLRGGKRYFNYISSGGQVFGPAN
ncbi:MAG: hypothetical protein ACOYB1_18485 [Limnohabitans sp.]